MSELQRLARAAVRKLKPYASARGITTDGRVFLDANEAPESGITSDTCLNRYPEPQPRSLLSRFSELYGCHESRIMIGRGSDEAIDLLVRTFCEAGEDQILITPPTYGVYEVAARIQGAGVVRVPLIRSAEWMLDQEKIIDAVCDSRNRIKLVFLCSPNNPTGTAFDPEVITTIVERIGNRALVVVDEAYAEWSKRVSMIGKLARLPSLVVLRTLSKAWASAGARCGVAIADAEVIELLNKVRAPYPLSGPAIKTIEAAVSREAEEMLEARVKRVRAERERLTEALVKLRDVRRVYSSAANFILAEFANREQVLSATRERGIIVRDRHSEIEHCIRITVGTEAENDELIGLLKEIDP